MTKEEREKEIKYRLSNIGEAIGMIALEYIEKLEKENKELKELVEWLKAEKTKFEDETIVLEYKVEELTRRI